MLLKIENKTTSLLFQKGVIHTEEKRLVVETLTENHAEFDARQLFKRETFVEQKKDRHLVLVYQSSASGGECGLKTENLKRMQAPPTRVILLNTSNIEHRIKRSTSGPEKMIELAVFVDEVLYASTKRKGISDPINAIQNIVFTYINSVSVLPCKYWLVGVPLQDLSTIQIPL